MDCENCCVVSHKDMERMLKEHIRSKHRLAELETSMGLAEGINIPEEEEESDTLSQPEHLILYYKQRSDRLEEEILALRFLTKKIERVISYLPPRLKEVVTLLYIEGKTYDEVCDALFIARSTLTKRRKEAIEEMCLLMQ